MEAKLVAGIVVAVIVIAAIGGVAVWMTAPTPPAETPTPTPPTAPTATPTPPSAPQTPTPAVETPRPSPPPAVNCEMCHEREKTAELEKHIMGLRNGKPGCFASYDRYGLGGCHGGPNAATCTHVSQKSPENATCEQCHGTNLIDIHLKQGKTCTVCHRGENKEGIDPLDFIHKERSKV